MTRKLLYVAKLHIIPASILRFYEFAEREKYEKINKKLEEIVNNCCDIVIERLKDYDTIDSIFLEGWYEKSILNSANRGDFSDITGITPKQVELYKLLLDKGARFKMTEDSKAHRSHERFTKLMSLGHYLKKMDRLFQLFQPYYHIYQGLHGWGNEIFCRHRDYGMGKRVRDGLRNVGFLSFGWEHKPLGYVRLLASDVELIPLYSYAEAKRDDEIYSSFLKTLYRSK